MRRVVGVVSFLLTHFFAYSQDLVVTGTSGSKSFESYGILSVNVTIKNDGIIDINKYVFINAYLSSDSILNTSSDKFAGSANVPSLLAKESKTVSCTGGLGGIAPGNYYLILSVDRNNNIAETDESNNVSIVPGYEITPSTIDFRLTSFTGTSSTIGVHDYAFVTYQITNSGSAFTGGIYTSFYLSTDNTLDANDTFMDALYADMSGASVKTFSDEAEVPAVAPGSYYIIAKVDDKYSSIPESNESNNTTYRMVTIVPPNFDLDVTSTTKPIVSYRYTYERKLNTTFYVKNNGTTGVVGYYLEIFLSKDNLLDQYDERILNWGVNYWFYVGAGKTLTVNDDFGIPDFVSAGNYYVIFRLNETKPFPETNKGNNLVVSSNQVSIPDVRSVKISNASFGDAYDDTDQQLNLNVSLTSQESGISFNQSFEIRIVDRSGATKFSSYQSLFHFFNSSYETATMHLDLALPQPLAAGEYLVQITPVGPVYVDDYSLPLIITKAPRKLNGSIRGEDNTPISKGKLFLYKKTSSGTIGFVKKISPTVSDQFSFELDGSYYTLYFVPDAVEFPDYVPTVLGKSVILKNSSFFKLANDSTLVFEILKTKSMESGAQTISGYTTGTTAGTMALTSNAVSSVVLLLTDDGTPLSRVQTNESGYYEFANIPAAKYQVLTIPDVDRIPMDNPTLVDVSITSATVDFVFAPKGTTTTVTPILFNQQITFDIIQPKTFGDAPFDITAHASSDLPVSYVSNNQDVAMISGNVLTIIGAGEAVITARQQGDVIFNPAVPVTQTLLVEKAVQVITMDNFQPTAFGAQPFEIIGNTNSPLDLIYTSSDPTVATVENNVVTIVGAGETTITATQPGDVNYQEALPVSQVLSINKAEQSISFDPLDTKRLLSEPFQLNAFTTSGLPVIFHSSNPEVATVSGAVVTITGVGQTIITATQIGSNNYNSAENMSQTLNVNKALQTITFGGLPVKKYNDQSFDLSASSDSDLSITYSSSNLAVAEVHEGRVIIKGVGSTLIKAVQSGNEIYEPANSIERELLVLKLEQLINFAELEVKTSNSDDFSVEAYATSLLPISFTSDNPAVATIDGNKVSIHGAGIAHISASQSGDNHYEPASTVTRMLEVTLVTGIESGARLARIYPNPTSGIVFFEAPGLVTNITVVDMLGRTQLIKWNGDQIDISQLTSGVYYIKIVDGNSSEMVRVVKE